MDLCCGLFMDLFIYLLVVFYVVPYLLYLLFALYFGFRLDLVIPKVFSNRNDSPIMNKKCFHPCSELRL